MNLFLLLAVLAIVVCISLLIDAQQPHSTQKATAFKNCKATDKCDNSQQVCAHYTCTTAEDAARINENNINLTCGADNVLKCTTKGTTTYCGCAPKN